MRGGALELVFTLPNQAWGRNHPCACPHARMCMCCFWSRHPNGPFCAHLGQAPARSTPAAFGSLGRWGVAPMAQGSFCQLKSASRCFHSWKRPQVTRNAGVSNAPNRPPQNPAPACGSGNRILCASDGALAFSRRVPELSRGFAPHLAVSILGNGLRTWPKNALKPENRFKGATNIAGLSLFDHRCIRLDLGVILDPVWSKMAH